MFDYTRRLQLALGDTARRTAMKVVAGLVIAVGVGFLLAALWSWLAYGLGWGPIYASLTVGGGFVLLGLVLLAMTSRPRHTMPTSDDLKREVEAQVSMVANAAADRARSEAMRVVGLAEDKVSSLMGGVGYRANKMANDAERRAQGLARDAAKKAGLNSERIKAAQDGAERVQRKARAAANSNAGSMAKLLAAFAVGITLAAKLRERRNDDVYDDEFPEEDDFDRYYNEDRY